MSANFARRSLYLAACLLVMSCGGSPTEVDDGMTAMTLAELPELALYVRYEPNDRLEVFIHHGLEFAGVFFEPGESAGPCPKVEGLEVLLNGTRLEAVQISPGKYTPLPEPECAPIIGCSSNEEAGYYLPMCEGPSLLVSFPTQTSARLRDGYGSLIEVRDATHTIQTRIAGFLAAIPMSGSWVNATAEIRSGDQLQIEIPEGYAGTLSELDLEFVESEPPGPDPLRSCRFLASAPFSGYAGLIEVPSPPSAAHMNCTARERWQGRLMIRGSFGGHPILCTGADVCSAGGLLDIDLPRYGRTNMHTLHDGDVVYVPTRP